MKKCGAFLLAASLVLSLSACSQKETAVFVQRVGDLAQMGSMGVQDRYSGIVVSESVTEIRKDSEKTVEELWVHVGDDVTEGQKLFTYDTEELQLTLEKQTLQAQQLEATITNSIAQIEKLEKAVEKASSADKPEYFLQIRTAQVEQAEAELNLKTKQSEIKKSQHLLENAVVTSPVTGRVTSISESGTDDSGKPKAYITIQKTGSFRVKGILNEMQRGSIQEGNRLRIESRLDPDQFWTGTVTLVDYENPTQGNSNGMNGSSDEMGNSSRYPFYVELDSSEGLLLGQHLYLSAAAEEEDFSKFGSDVLLSTAFVCNAEDGSSYVWLDDNGKLKKQEIVLDAYDPATDAYYIAYSLTEDDYVAFPDEELCKDGAPTTRTRQEGGVN